MKIVKSTNNDPHMFEVYLDENSKFQVADGLEYTIFLTQDELDPKTVVILNV